MVGRDQHQQRDGQRLRRFFARQIFGQHVGRGPERRGGDGDERHRTEGAGADARDNDRPGKGDEGRADASCRGPLVKEQRRAEDDEQRPGREQGHHLPHRHAGGETIDEDMDAERRHEGTDFMQRRVTRSEILEPRCGRSAAARRSSRSDTARTPFRSRPCRSRHIGGGRQQRLRNVAAGEREAREHHQQGPEQHAAAGRRGKLAHRIVLSQPVSSGLRMECGTPRAPREASCRSFSFIRTLTVGSGIAPKSADPRVLPQRSRARRFRHYRRWGLSPRPESAGPS